MHIINESVLDRKEVGGTKESKKTACAKVYIWKMSEMN